jgi:2-amino-4-hydroxy-6-hydroxymethyldihydropteridine diphosphokinase
VNEPTNEPTNEPPQAYTLAYVALGSNLGDRAAYLAYARGAIAALPGTRLVAASDVEETAPIGPPGQGPYLNQMVAIETLLAPADLLERLMGIERANGRQRTVHWGSRTLDLDIVRYGDQAIALPDLTIPHPQLAHRDFWQRELAQIESRS